MKEAMTLDEGYRILYGAVATLWLRTQALPKGGGVSIAWEAPGPEFDKEHVLNVLADTQKAAADVVAAAREIEALVVAWDGKGAPPDALVARARELLPHGDGDGEEDGDDRGLPVLVAMGEVLDTASRLAKQWQGGPEGKSAAVAALSAFLATEHLLEHTGDHKDLVRRALDCARELREEVLAWDGALPPPAPLIEAAQRVVAAPSQ